MMSVSIGISGSTDDSSSPPPCIFNKDPLAPDIVLRPSDGDNPGSTVTKSTLFSFTFSNYYNQRCIATSMTNGNEMLVPHLALSDYGLLNHPLRKGWQVNI